MTVARNANAIQKLSASCTPPRVAWLLLTMAFILTVLVYIPGLHGPYVLDDQENIVLNPSVALTEINIRTLYDASTGNDSSALGRPLAALSFALNHYFAGGFDNTLPFKLTNLVIHLFNALLVYLLAVNLFDTPVLQTLRKYQYPIAAWTAAIWTLHPIQLTSVLYVVQRMTSLSATFIFLGLIVFLYGRQLFQRQAIHGLGWMATGIGVGTLLGVSAKENAILLPFLALLIEISLYHGQRLTKKNRRFLSAFYIATTIIPLLVAVTYLVLYPEIVTASYIERDFTLGERLLTESRVLWFYVKLILIPEPSAFGLFHDDIFPSRGLFDPITTTFSLLAISAILFGSLFTLRRYPIIAFAVFWFFIGHSLESSIFGLELAYEHRNYLPSFGIFFGLGVVGCKLIPIKGHKRTTALVVTTAIIFTLASSAVTFMWARAWKEPLTFANATTHHHPHSARADIYAAQIHLAHNGDYVSAIHFLLQGINANPKLAGLRIELRGLLTSVAFAMNTAPSNAALPIPPTISISKQDGEILLSHAVVSDDAIRHLLAFEPITVYEITALEKLQECILEEPKPCHRLRNTAREWLAIAAANPRASAVYRAIAFGDLAQLHAEAGELPHAVAAALEAEKLDPTHLSYRLHRIGYLIQLRKIADAEQLLAQTETEIVLNPHRAESQMLHARLQSLRAALANAK